MNEEDNIETDLGNSRYYPSQAEQQYLIYGCRQYFSYPERSHNRNVTASQVTALLKQISPHWTHRAVRLWFNNNKKSVLGETSPNVIIPEVLNRPILNNQIEQNQVYLQSVQPEKHKVRFDISQNESKQLNNFIINSTDINNFYLELENIINQIKENNNNLKILFELSKKFDYFCQKIIENEKNCNPEKIKNLNKFISLPIKNDEFSSNRSISMNDSVDFLIRSQTPDENLYIWQQRACEDQIILNYDSICINSGIAVYSYQDLSNNNIIISYNQFEQNENNKWNNIKTNISNKIDSITINNNFIYASNNSNILKINLNNENIEKISIDSNFGYPILSNYLKGIIYGFQHNNNLFINENKIFLSENGITSLTSLNSNILYSSKNNFNIKEINFEGKEINYFIGHTNFIRKIKPLSTNLFCSTSDDNSIQFWDNRTSLSLFNISTKNFFVESITGNENDLLIGYNNKSINVIDIRNIKPYLSINTNDYLPEEIYYNKNKDELTMFGIVSKELFNSMMFVDDDGINRKRIFRKYPSFIVLKN